MLNQHASCMHTVYRPVSGSSLRPPIQVQVHDYKLSRLCLYAVHIYIVPTTIRVVVAI